MFSKNKIYIFLLLSVCLGIGQVVYAADISGNNIETSLVNLGMLEVSKKILDGLGNIVFGTITIEALLIIVQMIVGRKADIKSVEIELLTQKRIGEEEYIFYDCDKVFFGNHMIEKSKLWSDFYFLVKIKIENPEDRKKIHSIQIKKLVLEMGKFDFIFYPRKKGKNKYGKSNVSLDNDECYLLLEPPKIKETDAVENFSITHFFKEPEKIIMYIKYINNPKFYHIFILWRFKGRKIFFKKKNHGQGNGRIVIDNKEIVKGKYKNGQKRVSK